MKKATGLIIGLLVLATVGTAHPYAPYSDYKLKEQDNVELSEEAVAAYLKSKMEEEKLNPATIVEYVQSLIKGERKTPPPPETHIQGGSKGGPKADEPEENCVPGGTEYALQKAQLETVLDTLYPATGNPVPFATIVTPNHGSDIYKQEISPLTAYQVMLGIHSAVEIKHIWANFAPCPNCARALISHFSKEDENIEKPVIHIAQVIDSAQNENLTHIVETMKCLARLKKEGFDIQAWNFNEFKTRDPAFMDTCNMLITDYYAYANFTSALEDLQSHVTFIEQLGENPYVHTWC